MPGSQDYVPPYPTVAFDSVLLSGSGLEGRLLNFFEAGRVALAQGSLQVTSLLCHSADLQSLLIHI